MDGTTARAQEELFSQKWGLLLVSVKYPGVQNALHQMNPFRPSHFCEWSALPCIGHVRYEDKVVVAKSRPRVSHTKVAE